MAESAAVWSWLAPVALQATPLLAGAWLLDRATRGRVWPELVATAWWLALARLVLPPTLASPWSLTSALGAPALATGEVPAGASGDALVLVWLAGAGLCLAARMLRRRALARARVELGRDECPAWHTALSDAARDLGLARVPRLGTLAGLATPAVSGSLRPTVWVPRAALARAPTAHDRHALLHELAHVQRGDLLRDELAELLRALFWFHPLVWLAVARLRALGELACDARVTRVLGSGAPAYRDTLVLAAREALGLGAPLGVRAFLARSSALGARLAQLERPARTPLALVRATSAALALTLLACVLPMAPATSALRASAERVLAAHRAGASQSCFSLHAAAAVLAADVPDPTPPSRD
jgi:beta-lactamase regulating signal transducer with metallopeptidase domain